MVFGNKPVLAYKEILMQGNGLNKFLSIVSEVSSFVDNPAFGGKSFLLNVTFKYRFIDSVFGVFFSGALDDCYENFSSWKILRRGNYCTRINKN